MVGTQAIDARGDRRFLAGKHNWSPFVASAEGGGIDRLVAIGTTLLEKDLSYLATNICFEDVVRTTRGMLSGNAPSGPPVEQWTATETIVRISQER